MHPTLIGLLFTGETLYNLFTPLLVLPRVVMLCAWLDMHATVVLHYGR